MSDRITHAFGYPLYQLHPRLHRRPQRRHRLLRHRLHRPNPYAEPHVAAIANATAVPGTYADTNTPAVVNADAYTNSYCDGDRDCHAKAYV